MQSVANGHIYLVVGRGDRASGRLHYALSVATNEALIPANTSDKVTSKLMQAKHKVKQSASISKIRQLVTQARENSLRYR